jgi:putative transposase
MSRRGNPYDNPVAESFFKTLKVEEVYLTDYQTESEARARIPHFIDQVYNQERLHSASDDSPPNEFEIIYKQPPIYVVTLPLKTVQFLGFTPGP